MCDVAVVAVAASKLAAVVNAVFIGSLNVTTSVTLAGAGEKTSPSIDELTMYGATCRS